jgi:hypothetical protein
MSYTIEDLTDGNRREFIKVIDALLDKHTFSKDDSVKLSTDKGDDVEGFQKFSPYLAQFSAISPSDHVSDWGYFLDVIVHINKEELLGLKNLLIGKTLGTIPASLEINQDVPIISVRSKLYKLETLHQGATLDIINYVYKNEQLDKPLQLQSLKIQIGGTLLNSPNANLKQIFKKNPFLIGALKPFAEIGKKSIIFRREAQLTSNDLEEIQNNSKNSTS